MDNGRYGLVQAAITVAPTPPPTVSLSTTLAGSGTEAFQAESFFIEAATAGDADRVEWDLDGDGTFGDSADDYPGAPPTYGTRLFCFQGGCGEARMGTPCCLRVPADEWRLAVRAVSDELGAGPPAELQLTIIPPQRFRITVQRVEVFADPNDPRVLNDGDTPDTLDVAVSMFGWGSPGYHGSPIEGVDFDPVASTTYGEDGHSQTDFYLQVQDVDSRDRDNLFPSRGPFVLQANPHDGTVREGFLEGPVLGRIGEPFTIGASPGDPFGVRLTILVEPVSP